MEYLVLFIFLVFSVSGLFLNIFGLPGNILILVDSILLGWYYNFQVINLKLIVLLISLAVVSEVLEFFLGIIGAKKYKSSNKSVIGSIIGGTTSTKNHRFNPPSKGNHPRRTKKGTLPTVGLKILKGRG